MQQKLDVSLNLLELNMKLYEVKMKCTMIHRTHEWTMHLLLVDG